jgi:ribosomal-protein-alanine N-acetyltransferase
MEILLNDVSVVPLCEEAVTSAADLEKEALGHEAWSAEAIKETLKHNGRYFAAFFNGEYLGHGGFTFAADEGYITNVVVSKMARRQGVAYKILEEMFKEAIRLQLRFLSLEVRESNGSAIALYEKTGFTERGRRPNFYSEPKETAIIFTKDIEENL